jgi:hypothetical protein
MAFFEFKMWLIDLKKTMSRYNKWNMEKRYVKNKFFAVLPEIRQTIYEAASRGDHRISKPYYAKDIFGTNSRYEIREHLDKYLERHNLTVWEKSTAMIEPETGKITYHTKYMVSYKEISVSAITPGYVPIAGKSYFWYDIIN